MHHKGPALNSQTDINCIFIMMRWWGLNWGKKIGSICCPAEFRVQRENISRFNVDCEASAGLYGLAEGAFGTAGKTTY